MEPLLPQPGSSIDPRNAIGRDTTVALALRELERGNNLALTDPRRMGKTVLLDLVCARAPEGVTALKIDYEGVRSAEEFLLRTVEGLHAHQRLGARATKWLATRFDGLEVEAVVKVRVGFTGRSATALLTEVISGVVKNLDGGRLIIAMDEVPIAIRNIATEEGATAADRVLQTLRSIRKDERTVGWIVCGSIGFHHVLRMCDATEGAINDLVTLPLGPLDRVHAALLGERLLIGIERRPHDDDRDRVLAALVDLTDGIPFLIHKLAHLLQDSANGPVGVDDVRRAFDSFVADRDESRAVTHLLSRLDRLYGDRSRSAEAVLDRAARGEPPTVEELHSLPIECDLGQLLDDLVDDHYLVEHDASLQWRYDVLRRVWVQRRRLR